MKSTRLPSLNLLKDASVSLYERVARYISPAPVIASSVGIVVLATVTIIVMKTNDSAANRATHAYQPASITVNVPVPPDEPIRSRKLKEAYHAELKRKENRTNTTSPVVATDEGDRDIVLFISTLVRVLDAPVSESSDNSFVGRSGEAGVQEASSAGVDSNVTMRGFSLEIPRIIVGIRSAFRLDIPSTP